MIASILSETLKSRVADVLGDEVDDIEAVQRRASSLLPEYDPIAWEGSTEPGQFAAITEAAAKLGFEVVRWTTEPGFWANVLLHPEDRDEAVAYAAQLDARGRDDDFVYRALAPDGTTYWLHHIVRRNPATDRTRGLLLCLATVTPEGLTHFARAVESPF